MSGASPTVQLPAGSFPWHLAHRWMGRAFVTATVAALAVLLLVRLNANAFWDDEACTAQGAQGILRTGSTSAWQDDGNIRAYREGSDLCGFKDCVSPVLQAYVTATSFAVFGVHAWSGRLPFALLGLGTAVLMLAWARREAPRTVAVLAVGLLCNVSMILYERNCRYYSLSIFFSVALGSLYWRGKSDWRSLAAFAGWSTLLFASNYLNYLAFYLCLAVDFWCWQRRKFPLGWRALAVVFVPQLVVNGLIAFTWNPLLTQHAGAVIKNSLQDKWTLFCWFWQGVDQCEYFSGSVFLLAIGIGIAQRRTWLVRGCVAVALYLAALTVICPQIVSETAAADVRYAAPLIPLGIALQTGVLCALFESRALLLGTASLLVFGTNLLNTGSLSENGLRCTLACYIGELAHPHPDSYQLTADWINAHVAKGQSVWVQPNYAIYPLMFHAPRALYAWQLPWPPRPPFARLPEIHFKGQVLPDYYVAFGPTLDAMTDYLSDLDRPESVYQQVAMIDVYWDYALRPELFWHKFTPVTGYDRDRQAIYIFQRKIGPDAP